MGVMEHGVDKGAHTHTPLHTDYKHTPLTHVQRCSNSFKVTLYSLTGLVGDVASSIEL